MLQGRVQRGDKDKRLAGDLRAGIGAWIDDAHVSWPFQRVSYGSRLCLSARHERARHPHSHQKLACHPPLLGHPLPLLPRLESDYYPVRGGPSSRMWHEKELEYSTFQSQLEGDVQDRRGIKQQRSSMGSGPTLPECAASKLVMRVVACCTHYLRTHSTNHKIRLS